MKALGVSAAVMLAIAMAPAMAAVTLQLSPTATSEINVTSDSARGWIPSAELRQRALTTVEAYLDAVEGGRYAEAFGMHTETTRRNQSLAEFTQHSQKFKALAGPARSWRVLKITWTKDPARAPSPGIYVAVDLTGRFANVDRHCGYVILHQPPTGSEFSIMRRENNYLDNATARNIEHKHSREELDKAWEQLSRFCPNYTPALDRR